jgi:hypothetical protein
VNDKQNGIIRRVGFILPSISTCPIAAGETGLWFDGSTVKMRNVDGTDTAIAGSGGSYAPVRLVDTSVLVTSTYDYDATALTWTHKTNNTQATIDSVAPGLGDRVLRVVGDARDGIYAYTRLKGASIKARWTRVSDMNQAGEFVNGAVVAAVAGTVYANTLWELSFTAPFTLDSSTPTFAQTATAVTAGAIRAAIAATAATTPAFTGTASAKSGYVSYPAPLAAQASAGASTIVSDVAISAVALTIAAQPDVPRKLNIYKTDGDSSYAATLTIIGVGPGGEAVNEVVSLLAVDGTHTYVTANAFATITSATVSALSGNTGADKVAIGVASALGLPIPSGAASVVVYKEAVAATIAATPVNETVGTVDATARTVVPTTAADGTKALHFWFSYTRTPAGTVASHTHAL